MNAIFIVRMSPSVIRRYLARYAHARSELHFLAVALLYVRRSL